MLDDLRYAVRQLVKNPSFTVIAVFALALGIGANTAIFSVVNAVLLRPLPYSDPDKLIMVRESSHIFDNGAVGYMNWLDWHAGQQSFTDIALVRRESVNFSVGIGLGSPERLRGVRASSGFLSVLGFKPKLGRDLSAVDDIAGASNVALISENLWRHDFGASPSVLGRRVLIDGLQREIIGVFPVELQFGRNPDVLLPLSEIAKEPWMLKRDYHQGWSGLGRLKPGVTISQAASDLNAIAIDLEKKYPQSNAGRRVRLRPLFDTTAVDRVRECCKPAIRPRAGSRPRNRGARRARRQPLEYRAATARRKHIARGHRRSCRSFADGVVHGCDSRTHTAERAAVS